MHRVVCSDLLDGIGVVQVSKPGSKSRDEAQSLFDLGDASAGVDVESCVLGFGLGGAPKPMDPKVISALDALVARLKPTRLVMALAHCWGHPRADPRSANPASLFEVAAGAEGRITGGSIADAAQAMLPYMYMEEDRLAAGVRYEVSSGSPKVGFPCPPRTAQVLGARLGPGDIVTDAGVWASPGVMMICSSRWRWATMGPFQLSEAPLEDFVISRLQFYKPKAWPAGWFTLIVHAHL